MIRKVITYFFIFIAVIFTYRYFLYQGIKKNEQGIFNKYNELFLKKNNVYDVLFIGSSRAEMHFHPKLFDSITGLNSYNMGISGASLKISLALLKTYCLQHHAPKYLLYNIDYFALQNDTDCLNDFPRYFPYLENKNLRNELQNIDRRFSSFYYNPLHSLPYTQVEYLSTALHGWLKIPGKYDTLMYKGFQTSLGNSFNSKEEPHPKYTFISRKNRNYLDSLILFSKAKHIRLLLITSPVFGNGELNVTNKTQLGNQVGNIAFIHHIPYLNYTDSSLCKHQLFFGDFYHLNLVGAREFSKSISFAFHNIYSGKALINK